MSARTSTSRTAFLVTAHSFPEGGPRSAIHASCRICGVEDWLPVNTDSKSFSAEFASRRFRNRGWTIGRDRNHDECPKCSGSRKAFSAPEERRLLMRAEGKALNMLQGMDETPSGVAADAALLVGPQGLYALRAPEPVEDPAPKKKHQRTAPEGGWPKRQKKLRAVTGPGDLQAPPGLPIPVAVFDTDQVIEAEFHDLPITEDQMAAADATTAEARASAPAPRTPEPADRRRIMEYLDENYTLGKGYKGELNDAKAAEKLNVPRAWVTTIRTDFFGPEVNESLEKLQTDMRALMTRQMELELRAERNGTESISIMDASSRLKTDLEALSARISVATGKR